MSGDVYYKGRKVGPNPEYEKQERVALKIVDTLIAESLTYSDAVKVLTLSVTILSSTKPLARDA